MYNLYRKLSPLFKSVLANLGFSSGKCRYSPTCSAYARQAVEKYGIISGGWLAAKRLLKCHPWAEGGYDPVP